MIAEKKIVNAVANLYVNKKKDLIDLLNKYGASLKYDSSKEKIVSVLNSFIKSNNKFAEAFTQMLFAKGYLNKKDINVDSSKIDSSFNFSGSALLASIGGITEQVKGLFSRPEMDSATTQAIFELENKKLEQNNTGKYLIAGVAILAVVGISIVIIKNK